MANRQLFLHIGTHKTGTTSFQSSLVENAEALEQQGIAVFAEKDRRGRIVPNNLSFANAVLRPTLRTQARMSGLAKPRNWLLYSKAVAGMQRFLRKNECPRLVFSAEALCFARTAEEALWIQGLFKSKGVEIVPVVCFRYGSGWRESWHDYLRRWDPEQRQSYGEGTDDVRGDWYFDRPAILDFWQKIGPMRVVDYEQEADEEGSILPALYHAMEIEIPRAATRIFLNTRT